MAPPKVWKGGAKVSFGPPQSGKTKKYWLDWLLTNDLDETFEIVNYAIRLLWRSKIGQKYGIGNM